MAPVLRDRTAPCVRLVAVRVGPTGKHKRQRTKGVDDMVFSEEAYLSEEGADIMAVVLANAVAHAKGKGPLAQNGHPPVFANDANVICDATTECMRGFLDANGAEHDYIETFGAVLNFACELAGKARLANEIRIVLWFTSHAHIDRLHQMATNSTALTSPGIGSVSVYDVFAHPDGAADTAYYLLEHSFGNMGPASGPVSRACMWHNFPVNEADLPRYAKLLPGPRGVECVLLENIASSVLSKRAFALVKEERDYQDRIAAERFEHAGHPSLAMELVVTQDLLGQALQKLAREKGDLPAMEQVRKAAAVLIRALENHPCPSREDSAER